MNEAGVAILAASGWDAAVTVEGLEAKLMASMRAVRTDNWLALDNDSQFRAALGGVLLALPDGKDKELLERSIRTFSKMNSYLSAAIAGLSVELPEFDTDILPLIKMWEDSKK